METIAHYWLLWIILIILSFFLRFISIIFEISEENKVKTKRTTFESLTGNFQQANKGILRKQLFLFISRMGIYSFGIILGISIILNIILFTIAQINT